MYIAKQKIMAAEDFEEEITDTELSDNIDDIADQIDDVQDAVDDIDEDDINIDIENNITDHYIAECDSCHGIFISAMIESDQIVDHISGVCPICGKETDQYLNWIVREADFDSIDEVEVETPEI